MLTFFWINAEKTVFFFLHYVNNYDFKPLFQIYLFTRCREFFLESPTPLFIKRYNFGSFFYRAVFSFKQFRV